MMKYNNELKQVIMTDPKDRSIVFFSDRISVLNKDIDKLIFLQELPIAKLVIYDGSGKNIEITIPVKFKERLLNVFSEHINDEKNEVYKELKKLLNK